MLRRDFLLLLTLLAGISGGNSAAQPIRVLYPDRGDLVFFSKDVIEIPYETNFTEPGYLYTWCVQGVANQAQSPSRPSASNGTIQVPLNFTEYGGEQCWFEIRPNSASEDAHGLGNNSMAFNFVNATHDSGPTTYGPTSTVATATTLSTSSSSSATTSTTGSPQTSSPASSGLSTGAAAGIGVGAAIAGILIATIIEVLVMRWRKKKQGQAKDPVSEKTGREYELGPSTAAVSVAHEMPATHDGQIQKYSMVPQEMDAEQTHRHQVE